MTASGTFGWETLAPHPEGGRRITDTEGAHTVGAKVRTGGPTRGYLYIDVFARDVGWTILVLDAALNPVVKASALRKQDAWAECEAALKDRGLLAR